MTDLLYSEVEEELRSSVRSLLDDRVDLGRLEGPEPVDMKLWRTLAADLGFAGLPVPESSGGAGATWREAAVVMEELGRSGSLEGVGAPWSHLQQAMAELKEQLASVHTPA